MGSEKSTRYGREGGRRGIPSLLLIFFLFGIKAQLLTNFSVFRGVKVKFGEGVNSETLISYFMSRLPHKKINGFYVIFN